jgi:hypothetical protein
MHPYHAETWYHALSSEAWRTLEAAIYQEVQIIISYTLIQSLVCYENLPVQDTAVQKMSFNTCQLLLYFQINSKFYVRVSGTKTNSVPWLFLEKFSDRFRSLFQHMIGLVQQGMSIARPLPTQDSITQKAMDTHIHASSMIWTHSPSIQVAKTRTLFQAATVISQILYYSYW